MPTKFELFQSKWKKKLDQCDIDTWNWTHKEYCVEFFNRFPKESKDRDLIIQPPPVGFCPNGHKIFLKPAKYPISQYPLDGFEDLEDFTIDKENISIKTCNVEAGPYNGDNYLVELEMTICDCPICNTTFAFSKP